MSLSVLAVGCTKGFKPRQPASSNLSSELGGAQPKVAILLPAAMTATSDQLQISGTCTDGLQVHISGAVSAAVEAPCASGTFSLMVSLASGDGEKLVHASQTSGNLNGSDSRRFVRDATAPVVTIVSPAAGSAILNPVTVSGTCETGLNVVLDGAGVSSPVTKACAEGVY